MRRLLLLALALVGLGAALIAAEPPSVARLGPLWIYKTAATPPPPGACGTPPPITVTVGLTTCAFNTDFTQTTGTNWLPTQFAFPGNVSTLANWLDCTAVGSQTNTAVPWHLYGTIPCNFTVTADGANGQALEFQYLASNGISDYRGMGMSTCLNTAGPTCPATFPLQFYLETVMRLTPCTFDNATEDDGTFTASQAYSGVGWHTVFNDEIYHNAGCYAVGDSGGGGDAFPFTQYWSYNCSGCGGTSANMPPGYVPTNYHKYGTLFTTNGTTQMYGCRFVDDVFQSCDTGDYTGDSTEFTRRMFMQDVNAVPVGGASPSTTLIQWVKSIRVWVACPAPTWQTQQCNGTTFHNGPPPSLTYYAAPVPVTAFYVAATGSDSNPGTLAAPFATLAKCQSAMQGSSAKTCYVRGGTYGGFSYATCPPYSLPAVVYLDSADSGETWSYYAPDGVDSPILDGGNSGYVGFCIDSVNGNTSNITINGFELKRFVANGVEIYSGGNNSTSGTVIENNIIHDNSQALNTGDSLISLGNNTPNTTISYNYLYNSTFGAISANPMAGGFHPGGLNNLLIKNNIAVNASYSSSDAGPYYIQDVGDGTQPNGANFSTNIQILNNYCNNVYPAGGNHNQCIYLDNAASNVTATGNVMVTGPAEACALIHGGKNDVFKNNLCDVDGSGTGSIVFLQPNCGGQFNVTTAMTGNVWQSNIVVGNSASTVGGVGYWGQTGGVNCPSVPNPMAISGNLYYNYGGGSIVTTGTDGAGSDSNPTTANPQITCWKATIAGGSPYFASPVNGVAIPQSWGPNGAINPASLPGSPTTVTPSWGPSC